MYTLTQLKKVSNQIIRFQYVAQTDSKNRRSYVQREGTSHDIVQGRAGEAWETQKKHPVISVRNQNQRVPGDREQINASLLAIAKESGRAFTGLPGEYLPITCRGEGIRNLEVLVNGSWIKVDPAY